MEFGEEKKGEKQIKIAAVGIQTKFSKFGINQSCHWIFQNGPIRGLETIIHH